MQPQSASPASPQPVSFPGTRLSGIDLVWLTTALLIIFVLVWTTIVFTLDRAQFALLSPRAQVGVEAASAFARLFAALVLFLFPDDRARRRLQWVAAGILTHGLGGLLFGYLQPLLFARPSLNTTMYESMMVWTISTLFFTLGLVPDAPPRIARHPALVVMGVIASVVVAAIVLPDTLPTLVRIDDLESAAAVHGAPLPGLTAWHWALSAIPFLLAVAAAFGASRQYARQVLGGWTVIAMTLFASAMLHNMFWPSAYSPVLTTANLLRFAFAAVVCIAGVLELRRIASERAAVAAAEREYSNRLTELAVLRADFTSMVAHELGSPVAAIRGYADMLATGELDPVMSERAVETIRTEADLLNTLVADVRSIASVERHDFAVDLRPVPLSGLLNDAAGFAHTLPGNHPLTVSAPADDLVVLADPERIGQVLRNLLSNAAKYSPPQTPIELRAVATDDRVRIEVADRGYGIHPDDLQRVFEKFARGRDVQGNRVPGVGVGLYLSRRIVQLHGSDLSLQSVLGAGSTFAFDLEVAS